MRRRVLMRLLSVSTACLFWVGQATAANDQAELDKGRNAYLARQYEEADARFKAMLDPKTGSFKDPVLRSQALMHWGAVKLALKQPAEASRLFEDLLTGDPQFEPDPLSFPTDVLDVFSDTRHRLREKLAAQARETARREAERRAREQADRRRETERVARLEQLASEETVRETRNRYVAFVPFGAGQFQNGDTPLGFLMLGSQAAFIAVGTAMVPFYIAERRAMNETYDPAFRPDATARADSHRENALRLQLVNLVAYGAFVATAAFGIVQANLAFVPDTVKKQRRDPGQLPQGAPQSEPNGTAALRGERVETSGLRVWPSLSGAASGITGGLEGRF